jgi:hypothetical protein
VFFLTVSASTNELGSLTYNLFVVIALIHGAFLIATSFFHQVDIIVRAAGEDDDPDMTMGTLLLLIGGLITAIPLILASILPAKGKTTCIQHIVLGIIYFEMALVWMIWACIWIRSVYGTGRPIFGICAGFMSVATIALIWNAYCMHKITKLQGGGAG